MDRLKRFYINGILMTVVTLIIRYVSVKFNVYISGRIGTVAMGLFTLISSVYGFALTLATSGLSLATTKLVSEAIGESERRCDGRACASVGAIMKRSILLSMSISFSVGVALFLLSPFIGERLLGDVRTVSSLRILAVSLPPIALSSSLSGYFTAIRRVHKNAIVQMLSQALRIYLCVLLLSSAVASDMESACVSIVLGTTLSELIAFALHLLLFVLDRRKARLCSPVSAPDNRFAKRLLGITVPVAFSAYMRSALVTVEHLLIPIGLEKSGSSRDISLAAYGSVHSLVFPLIFFPSAISSSFAGLLVPEISESGSFGDKARIERIISRVLKTVLIYSFGVAAIMICLSGELGSIILGSVESAKYVALIAPLIPVMYLDTSVDSILKGLGYQFYSMIINIVDASLSVILVWLLLPRFGIMGYIITVYFTEIVNAALSITKLLIVSKIKVRLLDWVVKPLCASVISTFLLSRGLALMHGYAHSRLGLFIHIGIIAVLYVIILIALKAISPSKIKRSITNFFNFERA